MKSLNQPAPASAWVLAARLLIRWIEDNERVDALLDSLPRTLAKPERARCQNLLFGAVRHRGRIQAHVEPLMTKAPRPKVEAVLLLAGCELIEGGSEGHAARVIHHAVEQAKTLASPAEARLVNAVVRKLALALEQDVEPGLDSPWKSWGTYFSHPNWLVDRWRQHFGPEATLQLLKWNQQPAPVYARWRQPASAPAGEDAALFTATPWAGFYEVKPGNWPRIEALIGQGAIFLQDPGTRFAIDLLAPQAGDSVLDTCAAPGGKSLFIADCLVAAAAAKGQDALAKDAAPAGRVIAIDLDGPRIARLKDNLSRAHGVDVALVIGDLLEAEKRLFKGHGLPKAYPAVLVDVPCSNTGVMRHRVDVKWRLQQGDFAKHAEQQYTLLSSAGRLVEPGGRLVYSTCSLDPEENEQVVRDFVARTKGRYSLEKQILSFPWVSGHDGAAAFLIRKSSE